MKVENPKSFGPWRPNGDTWCIVLAAGSGTRLRELTTFGGQCIPKQFCAVGPGASLLQRALERASRLVPVERIVAVVDMSHRRWWRDALADLPPENIVVQPRDRGTAPGLLLPLLRVTSRDSNATVVVLPSDHHVEDEWTLSTAIRASLDAVAEAPGHLQILGIQPEEPDAGLGWIVPSRRANFMESTPVNAFHEKPGAGELSRLLSRGAAASSFILAAHAHALCGAFERTAPGLFSAFRRLGAGSAGEASLRRIYKSLGVSDFSRDVLERLAGSRTPDAPLFLVRVPRCGWSDLGTPERVADCFMPGITASSTPALRTLVRPPEMSARAPLEPRRRSVYGAA